MKVVNSMIVHILHMYNSKHSWTWDESLPYVQHSYNKAQRSLAGHNPFQVGMGFQPLCPIDVVMPLRLHRKNLHMSSLKLINPLDVLNASSTSASRSMISWIKPILNIKNVMISIGCHISFKWATNFGYICRRNALFQAHHSTLPCPTPNFQCGPPLAILSTIVGHIKHCWVVDTNRAQPKLHWTGQDWLNHGHAD